MAFGLREMNTLTMVRPHAANRLLLAPRTVFDPQEVSV